MAAQKVILRPISDISAVKGTIDAGTNRSYSTFPEGTTNLYTLVGEAVADDDATYIEHASSEAIGCDWIYTFGLNTSGIPNNAKITSVTMYIRGKHSVYGNYAYARLAIVVNGVVYYHVGSKEDASDFGLTTTDPDSITTSIYGTKSKTLTDDGITAINNYIQSNKKLPTLQYAVQVYEKKSGSQGKDYNYRFTQCHVEIEYTTDIGVHHKANGAWVAATAAYRKVNGAWSEISEDECKAILSSNLIKKA